MQLQLHCCISICNILTVEPNRIRPASVEHGTKICLVILHIYEAIVEYSRNNLAVWREREEETERERK